MGAATVCLTTAFRNLHLTEANPWDNGNLSFASTLSLKTGGDATAGPWTYSVDDTAWNAENVPPDQHRTTTWIPQFSVKADVGVDYSLATKRLGAQLTLMELDFASVKSFVKLAVQGSDLLSAEVGPTLALELQVSKQTLEDEVAKDIAEENSADPAAGERAAAQDVADTAEADIADAGAAEGEGFFGMSQAQIEGRLAADVPNIRSVLQSAFDTWLSGIQAGSADAAELTRFKVTPYEVPGGAADALEAESVAGDAGGGKIITCLVAEIVGLGPEDPIADGVCAAA